MGGGSLGKSKSKSKQEGLFNQEVFGPQSNALSQLYSSVGGLFGDTAAGAQGLIPGAVQNQQGVFDAANPAFQRQLGGGAYAGMDLQGMYKDALAGGGNEQFINESIMGGSGNDYVDAMKSTLASDSEGRLGRSLAMNDLRASRAGQSGSSRHGITESNLYDEANDRLADTQTRLGFETFDKDLDRKLGIAQRADQFDLGRLGSVENALSGQQGAMMGGLNFGQGMQNLGMGQFAPYMAPWQLAGNYANAIGRPTVLGSGSSLGKSNSKGLGASKYGGN
jgi:hypothetical protein